MSKTPRTDAAKFRIGDSNHFAVHVMHVEQLETELQEMIALADRLAEALAIADALMKSAANSIEAGSTDEALFYICSMPRYRKEAPAAYDNSKKIIS